MVLRGMIEGGGGAGVVARKTTVELVDLGIRFDEKRWKECGLGCCIIV